MTKPNPTAELIENAKGIYIKGANGFEMEEYGAVWYSKEYDVYYAKGSSYPAQIVAKVLQ